MPDNFEVMDGLMYFLVVVGGMTLLLYGIIWLLDLTARLLSRHEHRALEKVDPPPNVRFLRRVRPYDWQRDDSGVGDG